jgi:hypothetical protein
MSIEDGFDIEISGIEESCAMLDRVPVETRKIGFARALAAAAVPVVNELRAWTPVAAYPGGMFAKPGSLLDNMVTDVAIDEAGQGGFASVGFSGGYGHIANWLEYGHRIVSRGGATRYAGKLLSEVPPNPFMRTAAAASAEASVDAFVASLEETLVTGTTWASVADEFDKVA